MTKIMSRRKKGLLTGILIGAGLGVLFAPKKGSETRKDLANKLNELTEKVKEIELEDVKDTISKKITDLKNELADLDKEKIQAIARKKAEQIKNKAEELYVLAVEKGTPILEKSAEDIRNKTIELLNGTAEKLEKVKKPTVVKPKKTTKKA